VSKLPVTLGVAAAVVVLDQITKAIAVATLEGKPSVQVLGDLLQLTFVRNPGAAFSLAGNYTVVISVIAIVVATVIVRTARTLTSTWWAVVLGGVLGGALGNLVDRLLRSPAPFRGHVVDFFELPNWPVFNIADMALVGSAILAVLLSIKGVDLTEPVDAAAQEAPEAAVIPEAPAAAEMPTDPGAPHVSEAPPTSETWPTSEAPPPSEAPATSDARPPSEGAAPAEPPPRGDA
jgi:signal peptidase II